MSPGKNFIKIKFKFIYNHYMEKKNRIPGVLVEIFLKNLKTYKKFHTILFRGT